jgi:hypothetical protein
MSPPLELSLTTQRSGWQLGDEERAESLEWLEGIADPQAREAAEVPVDRPQFIDSVLKTNRGDPGVVDLRAGDLPGEDECSEPRPIAPVFGQEDKARRFEPSLDLVDG